MVGVQREEKKKFLEHGFGAGERWQCAGKPLWGTLQVGNTISFVRIVRCPFRRVSVSPATPGLFGSITQTAH